MYPHYSFLFCFVFFFWWGWGDKYKVFHVHVTNILQNFWKINTFIYIIVISLFFIVDISLRGLYLYNIDYPLGWNIDGFETFLHLNFGNSLFFSFEFPDSSIPCLALWLYVYCCPNSEKNFELIISCPIMEMKQSFPFINSLPSNCSNLYFLL